MSSFKKFIVSFLIPLIVMSGQWMYCENPLWYNTYTQNIPLILKNRDNFDEFKKHLDPYKDKDLINAPFFLEDKKHTTLLIENLDKPAIVKFLVEECKADINTPVKLESGYVTAVDVAISHNYSETLSYLEQRGGKKAAQLTQVNQENESQEVVETNEAQKSISDSSPALAV